MEVKYLNKQLKPKQSKLSTSFSYLKSLIAKGKKKKKQKDAEDSEEEVEL